MQILFLIVLIMSSFTCCMGCYVLKQLIGTNTNGEQVNFKFYFGLSFKPMSSYQSLVALSLQKLSSLYEFRLSFVTEVFDDIIILFEKTLNSRCHSNYTDRYSSSKEQFFRISNLFGSDPNFP